MANAYKIIEGSAAELFHSSRTKIRLYAGGFANGKTTALVADTLRIARDYPGCTMLLARATYPKLNSTLRREFFKWCPANWIKSFNKQDNTCVLHNGTTIDFRYIEQQGSSDGESTSNLLSANYDYIAVDQIEDPEITEHDFEQLLGRLRGSTLYAGDDPTMPRTGPRQIALACNPTLGWPYKRIVKPLHDLRAGRRNPDLICEVDNNGNAVMLAGQPIPLVAVFEASTYENAQNLEPDYIKTLEATYRGKMRDRYLLGKWVAFDGVVYDEFDENIHIVPHSYMCEHLRALRMEGYELSLLEGYDFGITAPSCYLLALVDGDGCVYIVAGFYEKNVGVDWQADAIRKLRLENVPQHTWTQVEPVVWADPAVFRKTNASKTVGISTAEMFREAGILMQRGNNNIMNGIVKVKHYLHVQETRLNPFTHAFGCPKLFVSDNLPWFRDEITAWRWKRNRADIAVDEPVDADNHAMDTLKYMLSKAPDLARVVVRSRPKAAPAAVLKWHEVEAEGKDSRNHRYAGQ